MYYLIGVVADLKRPSALCFISASRENKGGREKEMGY